MGIGAADLTGRWQSCGEELGVACVEVKEILGNELALGFIGSEDMAASEAGFDMVNFPSKVHSV